MGAGILKRIVSVLVIWGLLGVVSVWPQESGEPAEAETAEESAAETEAEAETAEESAAETEAEAETAEEASAETEKPSGLTIREVRVQGSDNVDDLISGLFAEKAYFQTKAGSRADLQALSSDIRRIQADYGPFQDIQVDSTPSEEGGLIITFLLTEYPRVGPIETVGNEELSDKKLAKQFTLAEGERFSDYELWKTAQAVLEEYQKEGYYYAAVKAETESITNEQGDEAVAIRLAIEEGEKIKVTEVRFDGAALMEPKELRKRCQIREGKRFQDEAFEKDPMQILAVYQDNGFLNAKVTGKRKELDESGAGMRVIYEIEEGPQFIFDGYALQFTDESPEADEEKLLKQLKLEPGDVFSASAYQEDFGRIQQYYGDRGNILVQVIDDLDIDAETELVRSTLTVTEGSMVKIGKVEVAGLTKTKEYVILRELSRMEIESGEPFLASNLRKAEQNIIQLGPFIQGLRFVPRSSGAGDVSDLTVELRENVRTGLFTIGGGYGSESGLFGIAEVGDGNLLGRAYRLNVKGELGQRERRVGEISFATPWILGTPTSFRASLFSVNRQRPYYTSGSSIIADDYYEDFRRGFLLSLGLPISRDMRAFTSFRNEAVTVDYNPIAGDDEGLEEIPYIARRTRSVTFGFTRDTRRYRTSIFDPIGGGEKTLSFEHSGGVLGGQNAFRKYTADVSRFIPSWSKFVFALHGQAGYLEDRSGVQPGYLLYERYWLGGIDRVRGYPDYSLLPGAVGRISNPNYDPENSDSPSYFSVTPNIGGNKMMYLQAEYRYPINQMVRAFAFFDAGQVWNEASPNIFRSIDPAVSVGGGLRLELVAGFLLRLEYGYPLRTVPIVDSATGEVTGRRSYGGRLHFSMGPAF